MTHAPSSSSLFVMFLDLLIRQEVDDSQFLHVINKQWTDHCRQMVREEGGRERGKGVGVRERGREGGSEGGWMVGEREGGGSEGGRKASRQAGGQREGRKVGGRERGRGWE